MEFNTTAPDSQEALIPAAVKTCSPRSGIPLHLARKPAHAMRISRRSVLPFEALSPNHDAPNWNVPATGGGIGGIETGGQLAFAVMKQRRSVEFQNDNESQLFEIVMSMMARSRQLDKGTEMEQHTFQCQVRGFLTVIMRGMDHHLASEAGIHEVLDSATLEEILADANFGLGLDSEKYMDWKYEN